MKLAARKTRTMSCFVHLLQLVVRKFDTVKEYKVVIKRFTAVVSKFNMSAILTGELFELAGKKLIGDVKTRWNSTYLTMERLLEVKVHVEKVIDDNELQKIQPDQWKQLKNLKRLLEFFYYYTCMHSSQKVTTSDGLFAAVGELKLHLAAMKDVDYLQNVASVLDVELRKRFDKFTNPTNQPFNPFYISAGYLNDCLKRDKNMKTHVTAAEEYIKTISEKHFIDDTRTPETERGSPTESPEKKKQCRFPNIFAQIAAEKKPKPTKNTIESDLVKYKRIQYNHEVDAAEFWYSERAMEMPCLKKVALALVGSVRSSVTVENLFSLSGLACSGR